MFVNDNSNLLTVVVCYLFVVDAVAVAVVVDAVAVAVVVVVVAVVVVAVVVGGAVDTTEAVRLASWLHCRGWFSSQAF